MKKIMLSFVTFCMLFCIFFGISVKNVYSLEDLEFGSFEIDLTKIKEGDVYKEYQDKEKMNMYKLKF